jgi:hypothetical protein
LGYNDAYAFHMNANYWFNVADDAASYGIGNSATNTNATPFSDTSWPTTGTYLQWGIGASDGSGDGNYWKDLGGWNGGNPVYPKLWYEE